MPAPKVGDWVKSYGGWKESRKRCLKFLTSELNSSEKNRSLEVKLQVSGGQSSKGLAFPRGFVAAVYDCRIGAPHATHRDAATATARQRARAYRVRSARRR
jgi:hypothetical protein